MEKILTFKFLVLGGSNVGKSYIIDRYLNNVYSSYNIATMGIDLRLKRLEINNKNINIIITDTSGAENYTPITSKMFFKGANGILVGFDLTAPRTLVNVNYLLEEIEKIQREGYPLSVVLFGTKCDDIENIKVKKEDIEILKDKYNIEYFETSAKNGINVKNMFEYLLKAILKERGLFNLIGFPENFPFENINFSGKKYRK